MAGNLELVKSVDESNFYKRHLIVLIQSNNGPPRSTERLLPFVILPFILIYPLGFHYSHNAEDLLP